MKKDKKSVFFPILINLKKFNCLVVGGGEVALRKVEVLLKYTSDVTILSPKVCTDLTKLIRKHKLNHISKGYEKFFLKKFKIVIAATNNINVNKLIYNDCKKEAILINVVDTPELCDFILPATVKRNELTISVSTQGKAPFLAKDIKQKLEHIYSDIYSDVLELAGKFRVQILKDKRFKTQKSKSNAFNKFLEIDWRRVLRNEGKGKANNKLNRILEEITP